jgi:hypothetical protein
VYGGFFRCEGVLDFFVFLVGGILGNLRRGPPQLTVVSAPIGGVHVLFDHVFVIKRDLTVITTRGTI